VKYFGEMEFWFAIIKVSALVVFLLVGVFLVVTRHQVDGHVPGLATITANGGLFPHGMMPMLLLIQGVVFAYAGVELCGIAAGETASPEKVIPKAVNSIMWRVAFFYVGSVVLLSLLLPSSVYAAGESPFVTVFTKLGVPGAADVMNLIVLTAALSSLNSGLYSTGRILRSMSLSGSAPRFTGVMSRGGVPYGGILLTAGFGVLGVILNYVMPGTAFELVINFASFGVIGTWGMIMVCSLLFWKRSESGAVTRPAFRLPWAPYSQVITLVFLASIVLLMWQDGDVSRTTVECLPLIVGALVGGWFLVRRTGLARAAEGQAPVDDRGE
jgi:L-asparagine permease